MKRSGPLFIVLLLSLLLVGCHLDSLRSRSLTLARRGFQTAMIRPGNIHQPLVQPPPGVFSLVQYPSAVGNLGAYLSATPTDGKKHPAIIWITGGDCNSVDDSVWQNAPADNDQTARAFRENGIIMMFPSLRGGNNNPGNKEFFYGEVDDVIAAADYLAGQPSVDPDRIYLGGHSTGGTLVLLVAESTRRFRAVFSFGPIGHVGKYGRDFFEGAPITSKELLLRSPIRWLNSIQSPVFVFEGFVPPSNIDALREMGAAAKNPELRFLTIAGANHFSDLAPTTQLIAQRVLQDTGSTCNLTFDEQELAEPFAGQRRK